MRKLTVISNALPTNSTFDLSVKGDNLLDDRGREVTVYTGDSRACKTTNRRLLVDGAYVLNPEQKAIFVTVDPQEFPTTNDQGAWDDWIDTLSRDIRERWRTTSRNPRIFVPTGIEIEDESGFKLRIMSTGDRLNASPDEYPEQSPWEGGYHSGLLAGKSLVVFCYKETGDGPDRTTEDIFIGVIHDLQAAWPTKFEFDDEPAPDISLRTLAAQETQQQ